MAEINPDSIKPSDENSKERKHHHLEMADQAQTPGHQRLPRFLQHCTYEPLFSAHPERWTTANKNSLKANMKFLGKNLNYPIWISSMTGGVGAAKHINQNLAMMAREFGFGMGLGSCRPLLRDDFYFSDFNLRPIIGNDVPFFANIGMAQVEQFYLQKDYSPLLTLVDRLKVDGLIIHVNPLQEYFQPEGDRLLCPPLEVLSDFINKFSMPLIVKEVGQGMGPKSLNALMNLPVAAIELAGHGGTNFTALELKRKKRDLNSAVDTLEENSPMMNFAHVGHSVDEMVKFIRDIESVNQENRNLTNHFIISGGIKDALDAWPLLLKLDPELSGRVLIGMARTFLGHATSDYKKLQKFAVEVVDGLNLASKYISLNEAEANLKNDNRGSGNVH